MVAHKSLWKWAASQSTQGSQPIKWNTIIQPKTPVHVGLRTVLARCPPPQPSSNKDIEEEEEESDEDLDEKDDEEEGAELVDPTIEREPHEPPEKEDGFQTASGHFTRGTTKALAAARVAQFTKATEASKSNQRTQKPIRRSSQNSLNQKSTSRKKPTKATPLRCKNTPN